MDPLESRSSITGRGLALGAEYLDGSKAIKKSL
jgi:hypothetical protein